MKPFWHLARVAASFIMLRESSENTEYNMAQVANVSQQVSAGVRTHRTRVIISTSTGFCWTLVHWTNINIV